MREIKFRAWIPEQKKLIYFPTYWFCGEYGTLSWDSSEGNTDEYSGIANFPCEINKENIEQFTGLYDKNGNEIYEGDILRTETDNYGNHKEHKYIVEWKSDIEKDSSGYPTTCGYCINGHSWEVIGNIHQNRELLNE